MALSSPSRGVLFANLLALALIAGCSPDTLASTPVDAPRTDAIETRDSPVAPDARADITSTPDVSAPRDAFVSPDVTAPADVVATADATAVPDVTVAPDVTAPPPDAPEAVVIDARGIPSAAALYTTDRARFGIRDIAGALDHVLTGSSVDNVILYVHGRGCGGGGEPNKSLTEVMPSLARDYTSAPVMLFWPGSDDGCPLGFPEARAREAGAALAVVLGDLYRYQLEHPAAASVHFTLITHSMGSLVLEAASSVSGVSRLPSSLFHTAVINSGASAASDHAAWVSRVTFSRAVFTTVNNSDLVLTAAGVGRSARLGKSLAGVRLAPGFVYVDFSANSVNHAYYLVSGQSGAAMMAFYQRVMNGLTFDFNASSGVGAHEMRDGALVQHFNGR